MGIKRHKSEEIVTKIRQVGVLVEIILPQAATRYCCFGPCLRVDIPAEPYLYTFDSNSLSRRAVY